MLWLTDSFLAIRDFMELGGPVLRWIAVVIFFMWVLIIERLLYFRSPMKIMSEEIHETWESRPERKSWNAHMIRERMISQFSMATNSGIPMIQTLVALCPLMGLMGTVTGETPAAIARTFPEPDAAIPSNTLIMPVTVPIRPIHRHSAPSVWIIPMPPFVPIQNSDIPRSRIL